jgi:hypothetical protein
MQLFAQLLQADWHALLGSVLIVAAIALAVQTLGGFGRPRPGVVHILRAYRPAEWSQRQSAHEHTRPMDLATQWQRVAAIAERGFVLMETVGDLHARAAEELEAVDDALIRLLEDFTPDAIASVRQLEFDSASVPIAQPLAA